MATTPPTDVTSTVTITEPLFQVKLLAALRNGDPQVIHHILSEISIDKHKNSDDEIDIGAAALHLAIRCASTETVSLLLSQRSISPNVEYPRGSGTSALHLAASIGRADVVHLLLEQEEIDDTLVDEHGKTCKDVARGKDVQKAIRDSRSLLTASYRSMLHSYIASPPNQGPPAALLSLLHSPRTRLIDLSYLDPTSGLSLLHEAARRKDLALIDTCIKAGADVFVRDRRGKSVADSSSGGRDDKVKVFLRQFTNQDTSLIEQGKSSEPPILRGYLSKYTNMAKGYNTRWFVLKNGTLSYYRHQDDEHVASRGSIVLKSATLKPPSSSDNLRFEISSSPGRSQQKWFLKGNHHIEVSRWVNSISRGIELAKREAGDSTSVSEGESSRLKALGTSIRSSFSSRKERNSITSVTGTPNSELRQLPHDTITIDEHHGEDDDEQDSIYPSKHEGSSSSRSDRTPPHQAEFTLHRNSTAAQVEVISQLLVSFKLPENAPRSLAEVKVALEESAATSVKMINDLVHMSAEREEWWKEELARERARGTIWEESLQTVVKEGAALEEELKNRARSKRRSSRIDVSTSRASMDMGRSTLRMRGMQSGAISPPPFNLQQPPPPRTGKETQDFQHPVGGPSSEAAGAAGMPLVSTSAEEEIVDTDEEDEFFDAIDANTLPNVVVPEALISPLPTKSEHLVEVDQYAGYKHLREKLPIEDDTRPPTSLWSVLKNSIGKDLTKITFPVFFNEPTSMLQRMAEDMEFSECLDAASAEADPHKRIALVAAFAMSNYSSTIGRIAKPFNPMLSETFEYVRMDKQYRYMSEQVSHHPPISACWAESPSWHYFGEVDAQNKFMGKSFEIRPTGVAHAELLLPESFGPDYPKAKGLAGRGKVIEHYSWKKVTTNVSGFILGAPTIDHYGDMTVTNHRTGDTCVLTFKPRAWRSKDAFEIFGQVQDSSGNVVYEIAGRWNSQLVARAVGTGYGVLHPDVTVETPASGPASPSTQEYILLWRNTEKPKAPFNLTPFAITLNDLPEDTLKPYLCPTDCRLRPDQRAFELGRYTRANDLKDKQEEYQRATRRAREEGRVPPHRPRWFEAKTDPETGERVWEPARTVEGTLAYWAEREAVWKGESGTTWRDVEHIFIEDEP